MKKSDFKRLIREILNECLNPSCERVCEKCKLKFVGSMICPKCGQDQTPFQKNEDFALGYSHGMVFDDPQPKGWRDPLNDPELTGKMNEEEYRFIDFSWLANMAGFNKPTDVYYGSIYIGTIMSKPNGYVIELIDTPQGQRTIEYKNRKGQTIDPIVFKTKDIAAKVLHKYWKKQRSAQL